MAEQNKAVTNHRRRETHLYVGPRAPPRLQSWHERGGQPKCGKHDSQLCLPSASAGGPPYAAGGAPTLTHRLQRCYQPGCISLAAPRRQLLALLMGAVKSLSCVRRKESRQCLNCELHSRKCFSSWILWRCSQISAYIGFSIYLFLFLKHSLLLYDEKKDRTAWMLTDT